MHGDADALLRVLTNLLDNAIRHGRGQVVLGAQRENGAMRLEVVDDGPGFAPDDLDHVFQPLFRSDRRGLRRRAAPASASRSPAGWRARTEATSRPPRPAAAPARR